MAGTMIISCQKDSNSLALESDTPTDTFVDDGPNDSTARNLINTAAHGLLNLSLNPQFRSLVHSQVMQKVDDDYNVLLRTLEPVCATNLGINLQNSFAQSITQHYGRLNVQDGNSLAGLYRSTGVTNTPSGLQQAIQGFTAPVPTNFLQIYVPFIDESTVNFNQIPVIAVVFEDDETCATYAFEYDGQGNWNVIYLTEALAKGKLVWVVGINETFDSVADILNYSIQKSLSDNDQGLTTSSRMPRKDAHVSAITINNKKECWLCGKADVTLVGAQVRNNCILVGGFGGFAHFKKVGNSDLGTELTIPSSNGQSFLALDPEKPLREGQRLGFYLFEKDKNGNKTREAVSGCPDIKVSFKSKSDVFGWDRDIRFEELPTTATFTDFTGLTFTSPDGSASCKVAARQLN